MDRQAVDRLSLRQIMDRQLEKNSTFRENKQNLSKTGHAPTTNNQDWLNSTYPESINRIIHHVHNQMIPQPVDVQANIASIPKILMPNCYQSKLKKHTKRCKKIIADRSKIMINSNYMSIPEIKAKVQTKAMQNKRRESIVVAQRRAHEIVNQKRILQNMLLEHQKLQRDRANIASEIQTMKSHLGDIKKRLDASLLTLKAKKIRC